MHVVPPKANGELTVLPTAQLSSRDRSQLMDDMVQQIGHLIVHAQTLSATCGELRREVDALALRVSDLEHVVSLRYTRSRTIWQRMAWLVRG